MSARLLTGLLWLGLLASWTVQAQSSTVTYIHTDALGSVVAETDAQGAVIQRREYEPYGLQLTPAIQDGPGYTGHVQDASTGLTYMQQRYYDPAIGRFLSVDPVTASSGTGANFNRYWYADNNPYRHIDPDGRQSRNPNTCSRVGGTPCAGSYEGSSSVGISGGGGERDITECRSAGCTNPGLVAAASSVAEGASQIADVIDNEVTNPINYIPAGLISTTVVRIGLFVGVGRLHKFSSSASQIDRNGLTRAGRALQKHGGREGSSFANFGHRDLNQAGQQIVDNIIVSSGGRGSPNRFGGVDLRAPDGRGARFDASNNFMGFLEP